MCSWGGVCGASGAFIPKTSFSVNGQPPLAVDTGGCQRPSAPLAVDKRCFWGGCFGGVSGSVLGCDVVCFGCAVGSVMGCLVLGCFCGVAVVVLGLFLCGAMGMWVVCL